MRILYLCCDAGIPVFGRKGASSHVRGTCRALKQEGHEVFLLCANSEGDQEGREGIQVETVSGPQSKKLGFDLRRILLDRKLRRAAERIILEWKPEAIYERYCLYSLAGTRLAKRYGLPHILEVNAFLSEEQADRIRIHKLARWFERKVIREASQIFVVSDPLKEGVESFCSPVRPIKIEPMSVDTDLFSPKIDGSELREELKLNDRFVIGYVGTLAGWHGIALFYDIAEMLIERGIRDFQILAIGGDGEKLERHRAWVRDRNLEPYIRFYGAVSHAKIPRFLRVMDLGLIPDANPWNAPTKLFEYQAAGIPAVGPDYPGVLASVVPGEEGLVFPRKDTRAMVDQIERLYRDAPLRSEIARRARDRVVRNRSWKQAAQKIVEHFQSQDR